MNSTSPGARLRRGLTAVAHPPPSPSARRDGDRFERTAGAARPSFWRAWAAPSPSPRHCERARNAQHLVRQLMPQDLLLASVRVELQRRGLAPAVCAQVEASVADLLQRMDFDAAAAAALAEVCLPGEIEQLARALSGEVGVAWQALRAAVAAQAAQKPAPPAEPSPSPSQLRHIARLYHVLARSGEALLPAPGGHAELVQLAGRLDRQAVRVLADFVDSPLGALTFRTVRPALGRWCARFLRDRHFVAHLAAALGGDGGVSDASCVHECQG